MPQARLFDVAAVSTHTILAIPWEVRLTDGYGLGLVASAVVNQADRWIWFRLYSTPETCGPRILIVRSVAISSVSKSVEKMSSKRQRESDNAHL